MSAVAAEAIALEDGPDLSVEAERVVARQFMGRIQWEAIAIGLGQCAVWFLNWALVLTCTIPLWTGFLIATVCASLAYLPSHEGQHGNISGRQKQWKWLDSFVGHITLIPLASSHEVLRVTHMKHHAYTNDPALDVDYATKGDHWWNAALGVHRSYASGGDEGSAISTHAERDPAFARGLEHGVPIMKLYSLIRLVMVFFFPLETLFLWWLPEKIGFSYLAVFFSWLPHHPMEATGRYRDTRFWQIRLPRYLDQSMQTHVIHHLYPGIPHFDEPKAMEALKPFMVARGVPGAEEIPERVRFNPLIKR
ncbi:MAG: fatty acid desaturase [Pseudomonadota bacterium]